MELVVVQVMAVLGKFAADHGEALLKEAGEAAVGAARRLFGAVMDRLKADPATTVIAEGYANNPRGYEAPTTEQLRKQLEADPEFAQQIEALLDEVRQATPAETYRLIVGSGAVAINHSAAATDGSGAATDGSTVWIGTPAAPAPSRDSTPERPPKE